MMNKNLEKLIDLSKIKIRAERIALDLTQEEFSEFVDIKYATYKSFEQNGKISFENYIKILIKDTLVGSLTESVSFFLLWKNTIKF